MSIELKIKSIEDEVAEDGSIHGQFTMEPLFRGFGHTIGNTIRRILLARIEGAAVTHVRVEGANHEFASLEGVSEDVLDFILNLKQLVVKMHTDENRTLTLKASGEGIVKASQIECPNDVEIINKDLTIAHLAKDGDLKMEITVAKGKGYIPAEQLPGEQSVDVVPVDAVFMPVRNVTYTVEPTTVPGNDAEFDILTMDIWTNGSVGINEVVGQASAQLIELMNPIVDYTGQKVGIIKTAEEEAEVEEQEEDKAHSVSVEELELSVRSYNCLKRANINTLGDLLKLTAHELMNIKNFGKKSAEEVLEKLQTMGYELVGTNKAQAAYAEQAAAAPAGGGIDPMSAQAAFPSLGLGAPPPQDQ